MASEDQVNAWFHRHRRENRYRALKEDGEIFGLTGPETAELEALEQEFGPSGLAPEMRTPGGAA